jgi:hypothetical protein
MFIPNRLAKKEWHSSWNITDMNKNIAPNIPKNQLCSTFSGPRYAGKYCVAKDHDTNATIKNQLRSILT